MGETLASGAVVGIQPDGVMDADSWNPLHRYRNLHHFPFVTNALLFYNDFPPTPSQYASTDQPP